MHLNSYVWISKLIAEMMRKNKIKGSILNLSSIYGLVAQDMSLYDKTSIKENASYAVIKSRIIGATKLIASTFGRCLLISLAPIKILHLRPNFFAAIESIFPA